MNNSIEKQVLDAIINSISHCAICVANREPKEYALQDAKIVRDMSEAYLNLIKAGNERGFNNG